MTKKIIILLLGLLGILFSNCSIVNAQPSNATFHNGEYIYGTYIKKVKNGVGRYETAVILRRSDGQFAYCIQPFVEFIENKVLVAYDTDYEIVTNMTRQQIARIKLLSYYGYGYGNHTDNKWYIITQMMIWHTVDPSSDIYFTDRLDGNRINIYQNEMAEIEQLIANHYETPVFDGYSYTMSIGQFLTINDTKGVLSQFSIIDSPNVTANINGNDLNITANSLGSVELSLAKLDTKYPAPPIVYVDNVGQDLMVVGSHDPVYSKININVVGGKIKIKKIDSETNSTNPIGQGTLVGAIYDVFDSNNNIVQTLTIGEDCTATTDYLPYGVYTIKERTPSTGYLLDNTIYTATVNSEIIVEVTAHEEPVKGKIQIKKVDSDTNSCSAKGESSLIGAKYGIFDWNNTQVDTLTIGNECSAISKELPYGNYTIKEITAPIGYSLDKNVYSVNITDKNTITITSKEEVLKGKIRINKVDKETNSCNAVGQSSLVGAKYGIFDKNNVQVDTLIIGDNCSAISAYLPYGKYKVKEIEAPIGYMLDTQIYDADIKGNSEPINITSKEEVYKNFISILKQYSHVDGQTTLLNAEANITFEIFYPDNTKYGQITTDKNGYATIELPYGVWTFHQVNTTVGFEKIHDFYVTVDEHSEKEQYYNILNNTLSAYVEVIKIDSETRETIAIADTTFKILNMDTNQYVSQFVGGTVYNNFTTDKNGRFVTYLKLPTGNYKLVEVSNPHGYLLDSEGLLFTIGSDTEYNYTSYGPVVTIKFANNPIKGKIEINKKGETLIIENGNYKYEKIPLNEVIFEIYAKEDITSPDGNHIYYKKGTLVGTVITDENGYSVSDLLPLGSYEIIEKTTRTDYILDKTKYSVELTEKDNHTPIVYKLLNLTNYLKKGELLFNKTDLVSGKPIPNTTIEVYTINNELVYTGITDENGSIIIDDLKVGKYYILERESATGYLISTEIIPFQILENGEVVKANMTNEKITSKIIIHKVDTNDNPVAGVKFGIFDLEDNLLDTFITNENGIIEFTYEYGTYYYQELETLPWLVLNEKKVYFDVKEYNKIIESTIKNEFATGTLDFTKLSISTSEPLPNTLIEIYSVNDEENPIFSGRTDENGKIILENLKVGKYFILEKEAPENFQINHDKMFFEIKENGEIVKATMKDQLITGRLIFTKTDEFGNPLVGVKINVYKDNEFLGTYVTNSDGIVIIEELEYGDYSIKELETIEGYELSTEPIYFSIVEDKADVSVSMINVKLPETGMNDYTLEIAISMIFIGTMISIVCIKNKKKKI